jgi:hypothetical protein
MSVHFFTCFQLYRKARRHYKLKMYTSLWCVSVHKIFAAMDSCTLNHAQTGSKTLMVYKSSMVLNKRNGMT